MVGSLSPNRVLHPERPCAICVVAEVRWASRSAICVAVAEWVIGSAAMYGA